MFFLHFSFLKILMLLSVCVCVNPKLKFWYHPAGIPLSLSGFSLNSQYFAAFIVTNGNPVGLGRAPLNLIHFSFGCCVC